MVLKPYESPKKIKMAKNFQTRKNLSASALPSSKDVLFRKDKIRDRFLITSSKSSKKKNFASIGRKKQIQITITQKHCYLRTTFHQALEVYTD